MRIKENFMREKRQSLFFFFYRKFTKNYLNVRKNISTKWKFLRNNCFIFYFMKQLFFLRKTIEQIFFSLIIENVFAYYLVANNQLFLEFFQRSETKNSKIDSFFFFLCTKRVKILYKKNQKKR